MKHNIEEVREKLETEQNAFDERTKYFQSERYQELAREGVVSPPYDLGWWLGYLDGLRWLLHNRPRREQLKGVYREGLPDMPEDYFLLSDGWDTRKLKNIGYKQGYGHALKWELYSYSTPIWRS